MDIEQKTAALSEYDFIIAIDKSGSMSEDDMSGGRSRWDAVQESALSICREVEKLDSDGLGIVLFGGSVIKYDGITSKNIKETFASHRPSGSTPLAEALIEALSLAGKSDNKDFIIVFTDGIPDDEKAAAKVIIDASNKLAADDELTILFVQIGYDSKATAYLKKLDDNLTGAKFDIVDAKTMEEVDAYTSIVDLIIDAIND